MAITPWSWTVSNGTASASQTKAAYTALTTGGMTYNFSRYVWNDIITKINAVANALGKGWNSEYLSYSGTKMHFLYAPLSAVMFNSARYNTNYLTWTWSYDPDAKGYIGRDDFKGVADVGEKDADFVYGAYILELVERLNTVIGIINGTGQHISLSETIGCFVETAAELIAASPQGAEAGESFSIIHSGTMELEKQRSWVLHFRISMPTHKASLEIGNFSFAEASLWSRLNVTEHFRNSPSGPMKVHFYFPQDFKAIRSVLPSRPLHTDYVDGVAWDAQLFLRHPQDFGASFIGAAFSDDCMLLLQPTAFSGTLVERLRHSSVMKTERMGLFAAQMMLYQYYRANVGTDRSASFEKTVGINLTTTQTAHTGFAAIMEKDLSYLLSIVSDAHVPKARPAVFIGNLQLIIRKDANIAHSETAMSEIPMTMTTAQKLNRYHSKLFSHEQADSIAHFAEMMQQQMGFFLVDHRIGYTTPAKITRLGAFPLTIEHTDAIGSNAEFSLEVMNPIIEHFVQPTAYHAFLQAEDLPSLYARVSTDSDEQFTSFEAQKRYYTDYINGNPEWTFVDIYCDEGISGTNTKHRDGFNTMIRDALDGKIDLIITKSLSRFARNTVDSLVTVRKLREQNIEVYFEKENLYTLDPKNEFMLTIFSSLAQEESRSISENVTWGQRQRIANGRYSLPYKHFLGYKKGENGLPEIVEEEAKIVRLIYREFLAGKTVGAIGRYLTASGIPTPSGKRKWSTSTVISILSNEKYKGDAQLQKTFVVDFLTKKQKTNEGEVPAVYIEDSHPAIIDPEIFERVQVEMRRRKGLGMKYSSVSCFSSKLLCADCGSYYGSKVWHSTSKYKKTIWQCNSKFKGDTKCSTPKLEEEEIKEAFVLAYNRLFQDRTTVMEGCDFIISSLTDCSDLEKEDTDALTEMEVTQELAEKLVAENARIAQDQEIYRNKYDALSARHEAAVAAHDRIQATIQERTAKAESITAFLHTMKQRESLMEEFDEKTWTGILDHVKVSENGDLDFVFYNGTEITVRCDEYKTK